MKKLLILMLVFCMASAANALVVQLSADGSTNGAGTTMTVTSLSTLGVVSDSNDVGYDWYLAITDYTYGDFGSITVWKPHGDGGHAGSEGSTSDFGSYGPYDHIATLIAKDTTDPFDITKGTQFTTSISFTGTTTAQTLKIDLLDDSLAVKDSVIVQVPEPMTIALLGLGGLLLRRRKAASS